MLAARCINALFFQPQPLNWHSTQDVRLDDLCYILRLHTAIPDLIRINYDVRAMLTVIQAAGFVGANRCLQLSRRNCLFEGSVQVGSAVRITTRTGASGLPPIRTDEDVVFELSH